MKPVLNLLVTLIVFVFSGQVFAGVEYTEVTQLNRLITFNTYGDGDMIVQVSNPSATCTGYWITKTDKGYESNLSSLLSAYHSKTSVKLAGHTEQKWNGSGSHFCKLYSVEFPQK